MTPAARVQAAIECLDRIFDGAPAEQALTGWARASRFAGSKDRAAVRDHVFGALRRRRSLAALGGGESGRLVMLGALRADGAAPEKIFSGLPYAPAPLSGSEQSGGRQPQPGAESCDLPDWLWPQWRDSLGVMAEDFALSQRQRAKVFLRVNLAKSDRLSARRALAEEGIETRDHPDLESALEISSGERRLRSSDSYASGLVELQDIGSQAIVDRLGLRPGQRAVDYCAGGGGKALAMAALGADVFAHDANSARMRDLPARARRAGAQITISERADLIRRGPYDVVLCDVPCSGSGTWARNPDAKWRLSASDLKALMATQTRILAEAAPLVAPGGLLAYATCSILREENQNAASRFLADHPDWTQDNDWNWGVADGAGGFFAAHFRRSPG